MRFTADPPRDKDTHGTRSDVGLSRSISGGERNKREGEKSDLKKREVREDAVPAVRAALPLFEARSSPHPSGAKGQAMFSLW